jgi:hypothetical protein
MRSSEHTTKMKWTHLDSIPRNDVWCQERSWRKDGVVNYDSGDEEAVDRVLAQEIMTAMVMGLITVCLSGKRGNGSGLSLGWCF